MLLDTALEDTRTKAASQITQSVAMSNQQALARVPFLVVPMEDESLHSIGVRWHILSGNISKTESSERLFGYKSAYRSWDVPAGLQQFESVSDGLITASEATLRDRTILRAYLPLLPAKRFMAAVNCCLTTSDVTLAKHKSGLATNTDSTGFLRLCPVCTQEHISQNGYSYWKATHQLPGCWICSLHKTVLSYFCSPSAKVTKWELPEHCLERAIRPQVDVADTLKLIRIGNVITWLCSKKSVDPTILHAMVKLRLRLGGLCRSEIKLLTVEVEQISLLCREHYRPIITPDIVELTKKNWFQTLYSESRHYNPLTWAMAIAFVGDTGLEALEFQYSDALSRKPQRDLFDPSWCAAKRSRAPTQLYEAFTAAERKQQAIQMSGLSQSEVNGWLLRDSALGQHWRDTLRAKRHADAVAKVRTFIRTNPGCLRVDVLRSCHQAYRWLAANDAASLNRLLPDVQPKFNRQLTLNFDL